MTYLKTLHPEQADSYDVCLAVLCANPTIENIVLFTPKLAPLLAERADLSALECALVNEAQLLKTKTNIPFWDAVMAKTMCTEASVSGILHAAAYHNAIKDNIRVIPTLFLTQNKLRELETTLRPNEILALASRVQCSNGEVKHIPQIDFHCPDTPTNRKTLIELFSVLQLRGYLLASGKSFHFYGIDLIDDRDFARLMGRILLFSPIVDRAWIAHQLIEGQSALRLSSRPGYGAPPKLVTAIDVPTYPG